MSSLPYKTCSKCGVEYPETAEYFQKQKHGKNGLMSWCKKCHNEYTRTHETKEAKRARGIEYRATHPDEAAKKYQYWLENKDKYASWNRQWRQRNKTRVRDRDRRYQLTPVRRAKQKTYRENNRHIIKAATHKRRARERQLPSDFTKEDWEIAVVYFNGCCPVCGRQFFDLFTTLTVAQDHWIPTNSPSCPGNIPSNIIPLCHSKQMGALGCNNRKGDKNAFEWLVSEYGKAKARRILVKIETFFEWVRSTGRP